MSRDRKPCPANPNGYDYHRWRRRLEHHGDGSVTARSECQFCHRVEDVDTCPPHQPSEGFVCPGFVRVVSCAVCLMQLPDDALSEATL